VIRDGDTAHGRESRTGASENEKSRAEISVNPRPNSERLAKVLVGGGSKKGFKQPKEEIPTIAPSDRSIR